MHLMHLWHSCLIVFFLQVVMIRVAADQKKGGCESFAWDGLYGSATSAVYKSFSEHNEQLQFSQEVLMPTSCLQRDTSCYAAIRSSQHAHVWCCHARRQHNFAIAWACCLHAWQSCAVSVHGTDILSPSMTRLCCVRA